MAYLGVRAVGALATAAVEVRYLALLTGCHQFGGERYADAFPARGAVDVGVGGALIPHAQTAAEVVADGAVEVLTIDEQVVGGGCQVALHEVAVDGRGGCTGHTPIAVGVVVVVGIGGFGEVAVQDAVGLVVVGLGRGVGQEVLRLVAVLDAQQPVVVEQRRIEGFSVSVTAGHCAETPVGVVVALEVDGRHARIGLACAVGRALCQIDVGVEVG